MVQESEPETQAPIDVGEPMEPPAGGQGMPVLVTQFVVGIAAAVLVVAVAAGINHAWPIFGTSGGSKQVAAALPTAQATAGAPTPVYVQVDVADAPTKGPANAKVTIVEFSDFECPYCARFESQTLPSILSNYGDKVLIAFRNYPLPATMHPYAQKAAEAGECANDQSAFWPYHDLLFQNQTALAALITADPTNGVTQVVAKLKEYAASLSLDATAFNQCLDSGADAAKVASDQAAMTDALAKGGVKQYGTPTFFINGLYVSGAYPYDENSPTYQAGAPTFKQMIDAALAAAK